MKTHYMHYCIRYKHFLLGCLFIRLYNHLGQTKIPIIYIFFVLFRSKVDIFLKGFICCRLVYVLFQLYISHDIHSLMFFLIWEYNFFFNLRIFFKIDDANSSHYQYFFQCMALKPWRLEINCIYYTLFIYAIKCNLFDVCIVVFRY